MPPVHRVLVLGCPGSGKSRLARQLADRSGLPLVHLDQIYWSAGWKEPTSEEWRVRLEHELAKPAWIMDGNYGATLARRLQFADAAILLDLPTAICLWRAGRRIATNWNRVRPDMAPGCAERFHPEFLAYILGFRQKQRPGLMQALADFPGRKLILTSSKNKEIERAFALLS